MESSAGQSQTLSSTEIGETSIFVIDPRLSSALYFGDDRLGEEYVDNYYEVYCRYRQKMHFIGVNDDKQRFLHFIDNFLFWDFFFRRDIDQDRIWTVLFSNDAVRCVSAVLDGETGELFYLPALFKDNQTPLEVAADFGSYRLTKLLLDRGGFKDTANCGNALKVALQPRWPIPTDSLIRHLAHLCQSDMRDMLETVRILAYANNDIQQDFLEYALEGSVQEVATLLLTAHHKVLSPHGGSILKEKILEEAASLVFWDVGSAAVGGTQHLTAKRMSLHQILALLEIFDRIGHQLSLYLRTERIGDTHYEIAKLFKGAGISVKSVPNLFYRSFSELFTEETILPTYLEDDGDSNDRAVNGLTGFVYPKCGKVKTISVWHNRSAQRRLEDFMRADDSLGFINCVTSMVKGGNSTNGGQPSVSELLNSICHYRALDCATSLLEGRTGLIIQLNTPMEDRLFPLHLSAMSLSSCLTQLFLHHGARTDVQCSDGCSPFHDLFPLDLALGALCLHQYVSDWTPKKSIFKLIYIFCMPELIEPLKTIKLLASDSAVVQNIGLRCVKEGKLVELAALLMVSWDMLVTPGTNGEINNSFIGKHILSQLQKVLHQELKLILSNDEGLLQQVRVKKGALLFASSMLQILKSAREAIDEYRLSLKAKDITRIEVPYDVSNVLKNLGFCLESNDVDVNDIKCLLREAESERTDVARDSETDGPPRAKPPAVPMTSDRTEPAEEPTLDHLIGGLRLYIQSPSNVVMSSSPSVPRCFHGKPTNSTGDLSRALMPFRPADESTRAVYSFRPGLNATNWVRKPSSPVGSGNRLAFLASLAKRWLRYF